MRRVIITGYMGAGKTTLGRIVARDLNLPFYDLDTYIENRMRQSITQIFETQGEEQFRKIEHNMLHEVAEFENVVISLGGGTPCFYDNMAYCNRKGQTIYLQATPQTLLRHIKMSKRRPLIDHSLPDEECLRRISDQLRQREEYYLQARHVIPVPTMDSAAIIARTAQNITGIITTHNI